MFLICGYGKRERLLLAVIIFENYKKKYFPPILLTADSSLYTNRVYKCLMFIYASWNNFKL